MIVSFCNAGLKTMHYQGESEGRVVAVADDKLDACWLFGFGKAYGI